MEPAGYDRAGNTYYILDDNRLYRRTPWTAEPPPPPKKSKAKRKAAKRRRVSTAEEDGEEERSIGGLWSCVCVSLHDWTVFVSSFDNSKDVDEKALRAYLKEEVVPDLTKTWLEKEKQRQLQEAVANRKRSGRLDAKIARQKEEEQKAAAAKKEAEAAAAARKERLEAEKKEKVCCRGNTGITCFTLLICHPGASDQNEDQARETQNAESLNDHFQGQFQSRHFC